jgi:REP element-mobilizing transposase RayT
MPDVNGNFQQFRNRLTQWRIGNSTYFITWRIHPQQAELSPAERDVIVSALKHFNGDRYSLLAYVVMNDHVHALAKPKPDHQLSKILHSWKSFTAHRLQRESGRTGSIWQKDSYTHIIRDESDFFKKAEYILSNPAKRWPEISKYRWVEWLGM